MASKTKEKQHRRVKVNAGQESLSRSSESSEIVGEAGSADQALQIAANALIAEYNAMRAASLARDQIFSTVANFGVVLIAAVIASLPTVVSQQRYQLLLPLFSFLASSLALANMSQRWLLENLARYENDVLSNRLQLLFKRAAKTTPFPELNGYWQWQAYLKRSRSEGPFLYKLSRRLSSMVPALLPLLASAGFILLFLYHRGLSSLTLPEEILFYVAIAYGSITFLVYLVFLWGRRRSYT